jgi:SAM-dependent methyltransferase
LGNSPRYTYVAADVYKLPFVTSLFDGATMIRTLHHMAEPGLALEGIRRVLTQDAIFILEFANKRNLKAVFRYLSGKQVWNPFSPEQVEFAALNFDFHPKTIRRLLAEINFKIERQLAVSYFRVGWLKRHLPLGFLVGLDSALQWTGAFAQFSPSVFLRAKALGAAQAVQPGGFFACPICATPLEEHAASQACPGCSHLWEYADGIYDFRINSGT